MIEQAAKARGGVVEGLLKTAPIILLEHRHQAVHCVSSASQVHNMLWTSLHQT